VTTDILLLGGGGFIGSALARQLGNQGHRVHILSKNCTTRMDTTHVCIHPGSLDNQSILENCLQVCGIVVHLASCTTPGTSSRNPACEAELNLAPTLRSLEILSRYPDKRLIFISSGGTLYGNPASIPAHEEMRLQPLSYHGAGKVALESFITAFAHLNRYPVTIVRPANIYGPGQPLRSGFGFIRTVLEHLLKGTELEIWGDGESIIRDFLHIDDMIAALIGLMEIKPQHTTYNVGSATGYSLNQVIDIATAISGRQPRVDYRPARQVDVHEIVLDTRRIRQETGWHPSISLEKGMRSTWEWLTR